MALTPTDVEYGTHNWSFYPGCLHKQTGVCPVPHCWAEGMWKRQVGRAAKQGITLPDFRHPHLIPERLLDPTKRRKPAIILVDFMGDPGGEWVDPEMITDYVLAPGMPPLSLREVVFRVVIDSPQHTFLFLTKNPAAWAKWNPWPDNAFVGATVWNQNSFNEAIICLDAVKANHKWLSIEPLLEEIIITPAYDFEDISWVVIGAQQNPTIMPKIKWVWNIVEGCVSEGVPVWMKDNIRGLIPARLFRQERPF